MRWSSKYAVSTTSNSPQAMVSGWFADNYLSVVVGKRLLKLRAKQVVLASGALEQPALFRNNDLPGIMLGGAARDD